MKAIECVYCRISAFFAVPHDETDDEEVTSVLEQTGGSIADVDKEEDEDDCFNTLPVGLLESPTTGYFVSRTPTLVG